jgi:hypothetical protein
MCVPGLDPLTLAGVAASVGGSVMNNRAQNQAISEQNRQNQAAMIREREAREAETGRQREFELAQAESVTRALSEADPVRTATESQRMVDEPSNQVVAAADDYNVPTLQGQVQNADVNENIGQTIAGQTARTREMLRSAALLQAQGVQNNQIANALFGMGSDVANIGSNRRGSIGVAQLETRIPAATVTRSSSPIGDLLMLGGQSLAGFGGQKAGFGATPYSPNAFRPVATGQLGSLF